jgi:hypothetical protein
VKHTTKLFLILALVATPVASVPAASYAVTRIAWPAPPSAAAVGGPTEQSWWGAAAGFGCRMGFGYIGTPAFAMFGGFCALALVDDLLS